MSAAPPPVAAHPHSPYGAILTLDPAGVGASGVAGRLTSTLGAAERGRLRSPDFQFAGWVFEPQFADDLALWLARHVGQGLVLLAVDDTAYGSFSTARSIGTAIGRVQSLLHDLNVCDPRKHCLRITGKDWRKHAYGSPLPKGRDALKEEAIARVATLYGQEVTDDLAEAILMNDYVVTARPEAWRTKTRKAS